MQRLMSVCSRVFRSAEGPVPRGIDRSGPAILSYGFRPFFLGAGVWAVVAMLVWIGDLTGVWSVSGSYGSAYWHGHEMLFGYTSAAFAGFMLTAIPNWTGQLPVSGRPLLFLVSIWLAGRVAMLSTDLVGTTTSIAIDMLFFPILGAVATREIGAGRNWKNIHVVVAIAVLTIANGWYHFAALNGDTGPALRLAISTWTLLISLIGGRLAVSFTRNWLSRLGDKNLPASFGTYDRVAISATLLSLLSWIVWPTEVWTSGLAFIAAALQGGRLLRWRGWKVVTEPLVFVLHTAYAFIPIGLLAIGLSALGVLSTVSALHLLTVGLVGKMTLAVMTRATRGHTGRSLTASRMTALSYFCLSGAALLRPLADMLPEFYLPILVMSALLWLTTFSLFVAEHAPMLLTRRK